MALLAFDPWRGVADVEWGAALLVFAVWYGWASRVFRVSGRRRACFAAGLLLIAVALLSPVEHIALDSMLSFHLLQNVILADWAPPLLVLGLSPAMAAAAERRRAFRAATTPVAAIAYWLAVWYAIHVPAVYGYALDHRWALGLEHLAFLSAGVLFWWPVLVPDRMAPAPKLAYLGAAFFLAAPLAAVITLSSTAFYPYYDSTPHLWGLSPLEDQQIGGILMAVEQSIILFAVFSRTFMQMLAEDERAGEPLGSG